MLQSATFSAIQDLPIVVICSRLAPTLELKMEHEYAYLAAMIDGEGTITIHCHPQHNRNTLALRPRVIVVNTNEFMLMTLRNRHGGTVKVHRPSVGNARECFLWRLCALPDILTVLRGIEPYLLVKREHVRAMLEFGDLRMNRRGKPYQEDEFKIVRRLRDMNRRGVV
jgi:hypothetical protein